MTFRPIELQVTTNFSFLQGGSRAQELAAQAAALGYEAIGVTDRNTLAGIVRAFDGCEQATQQIAPIRLIVGCRLDLTDAPSLLCYPEDRAAYGRLCTLLTLGKRRTEKGKCLLHLRRCAGSSPRPAAGGAGAGGDRRTLRRIPGNSSATMSARARIWPSAISIAATMRGASASSPSSASSIACP